MAHAAYPISSLTSVPDLVQSFAEDLGFLTDLSEGVASVQHPTYAGAKIFSIEALSDGEDTDQREWVELRINVPGSNEATAVSPLMWVEDGSSEPGAVVVLQPSALHLFGEVHGDEDDAGGSFIAGVIEYGPNLYRHFYLGYVEKITAYGGGEIISGSAQGAGPLTTTPEQWTALSNGACKLPFSAVNGNSPDNGGMHVNHANAHQPWYSFNTGLAALGPSFSESFSTPAGNSAVMGGYRDSVNSGYVVAAQSTFANAQIMVPVNLYFGRRENNQQFVFPVGAPAGVRLVNIELLEPGAEIMLGSSVWRVFPLFSKDVDPVLESAEDPATGLRFAVKNTSHFIGQAYRVSE